MASTALSQDNQAGLRLTALESEPTPICCCSFLDESLGPDEHLVDCELQLLGGDLLYSASASDSNSSEYSPSASGDSAARRRKHRESMARLRQKLRDSIGTLQRQEQRLVETLQRTVDEFPVAASAMVDTRLKLRQAYFELVKEQLALQDERSSLDDSWAEKAAYERLVQRELQRVKEAAMTTLNGALPNDSN